MYKALQLRSLGLEYAVEVGGQMFEIGCELFLAKQELNTLASQGFPVLSIWCVSEASCMAA
eukprot:9470750-Pyramimonas_sp.AAC.2